MDLRPAGNRASWRGAGSGEYDLRFKTFLFRVRHQLSALGIYQDSVCFLYGRRIISKYESAAACLCYLCGGSPCADSCGIQGSGFGADLFCDFCADGLSCHGECLVSFARRCGRSGRFGGRLSAFPACADAGAGVERSLERDRRGRLSDHTVPVFAGAGRAFRAWPLSGGAGGYPEGGEGFYLFRRIGGDGADCGALCDYDIAELFYYVHEHFHAAEGQVLSACGVWHGSYLYFSGFSDNRRRHEVHSSYRGDIASGQLRRQFGYDDSVYVCGDRRIIYHQTG